MSEKKKILIVDDDEDISELISLYLIKECFDAKRAEDGDVALSLFKEYQPDLILLDIMLPGKDGYDICREIRKTSKVPIIMLSAKGEIFDKVLGLELGADDYMIKPFDSKELVARVKAVLRRFTTDEAGNKNTDTTTGVEEKANVNRVRYADLEINLTNYSVTCNDKRVEMPPKELELFYFLASHPNQVFTREQLLDRIWGYEYIGDTRTVDVHVKRLRQKISDHSEWRLSTVWGVGYKFETLTRS